MRRVRLALDRQDAQTRGHLEICYCPVNGECWEAVQQTPRELPVFTFHTIDHVLRPSDLRFFHRKPLTIDLQSGPGLNIMQTCLAFSGVGRLS